MVITMLPRDQSEFIIVICNKQVFISFYSFLLSDEDVKNFVTNHDKKDQDQANLYVLMCYQGNGGTVGIAWVGTVCGSDVTYRISMNAWFGSDQMSGEV